MNKQEAIEKIKNIETLNIKDMMDDKGVDMVIKNQVLDIVSKIDEQQKPVVPKFVAEWIKKHKEDGCRLSHALEDVFNDSELSLYIKQQEGDYTEIIAEAWIAHPNITVEQEKLYTVEIPDPHGIYKILYLFRNSMGNIRIRGDDYRDALLNVKAQLTEAEIKQDFEWAFQFANPVEEEE